MFRKLRQWKFDRWRAKHSKPFLSFMHGSKIYKLAKSNRRISMPQGAKFSISTDNGQTYHSMGPVNDNIDFTFEDRKIILNNDNLDYSLLPISPINISFSLGNKSSWLILSSHVGNPFESMAEEVEV